MNHFSFDGRATRSQFWGTTIIALALFGLSTVFTLLLIGVSTENSALFAFSILMFIALVIACVWVQIAVTIKRCRDAGISPFWTVGTFIPYIALIVFIVIGVLQTDNSES